MKKLSYIFFSLLVFASFSSCDRIENTAEPSHTTFLPKMTLLGADFVQVACGEDYADAGVEVTENGSPINADVEIAGSYFDGTAVAGADDYVIAYSATNVDGIPGSAFREVVVEPCRSDNPGDIAGLYTAHTARDNGEEYDVANVFLVKTGDNTFALSDVVGGFYDLGRGYGSDYACKGAIVTVNDIATNDITVSQGQFPVWGNVADISNFTVSGDVITFDVLADFGGVWAVTLTLL